MLLYILIGVAVVAALVLLAAFVGPDRLRALWNALPAPWRTFINVVVGAAVVAVAGYLYAVAQGQPFDARVLLFGIFNAVATVIWKALNPVDSGTEGYGFGNISTPPPEPVDPDTVA